MIDGALSPVLIAVRLSSRQSLSSDSDRPRVVHHHCKPQTSHSIAPDWLSKASEAHPPASLVEADLLQQLDEARLGTKRVVVMVNLDPRQIPVAIIVGLFQQVERGPFVAEHRVYRCRVGRRNIDVRRHSLELLDDFARLLAISRHRVLKSETERWLRTGGL